MQQLGTLHPRLHTQGHGSAKNKSANVKSISGQPAARVFYRTLSAHIFSECITPIHQGASAEQACATHLSVYKTVITTAFLLYLPCSY
jgi:hypothetical protein